MHIMFQFDDRSEAGQYLRTCARIRNISLTSLIRRLIATAAEDQMVSGILDDGDCIRARRKGEHRYEGPAV